MHIPFCIAVCSTYLQTIHPYPHNRIAKSEDYEGISDTIAKSCICFRSEQTVAQSAIEQNFTRSEEMVHVSMTLWISSNMVSFQAQRILLS